MKVINKGGNISLFTIIDTISLPPYRRISFELKPFAFLIISIIFRVTMKRSTMIGSCNRFISGQTSGMSSRSCRSSVNFIKDKSDERSFDLLELRMMLFLESLKRHLQRLNLAVKANKVVVTFYVICH